jgi:hypothetical protein
MWKKKLWNTVEVYQIQYINRIINRCVKTACILVKVFDEPAGKITNKFRELVQIFTFSSSSPQEAVAEHLFSKMTESSIKRNMPTENIIGFASDECNTMMGQHNSESSRFKEMCPGISVYKYRLIQN